MRQHDGGSGKRGIHPPECPDYMDRHSALQVMLAATGATNLNHDSLSKGKEEKMTRKQFLTRTEIAKMQGVQKTHFLNSSARHLNRSLCDAAGLAGFGFHLVEIPVGSVSSEFHAHHN